MPSLSPCAVREPGHRGVLFPALGRGARRQPSGVGPGACSWRPALGRGCVAHTAPPGKVTGTRLRRHCSPSRQSQPSGRLGNKRSASLDWRQKHASSWHWEPIHHGARGLQLGPCRRKACAGSMSRPGWNPRGRQLAQTPARTRPLCTLLHPPPAPPQLAGYVPGMGGPQPAPRASRAGRCIES